MTISKYRKQMGQSGEAARRSRVLQLAQITGYLLLGAVLLCLPGMVSAQSLGEVLHQVEQKAPQLHAASARENASSAGINVAKSQYWGHAEVFGQTTHYNDDRLVNPISFPPALSRDLFDKNTYGYGTTFTLPVDIDGRIAARVHAQEHLSQAASEDVRQTRLSLFAQTANVYRALQRLDGVKRALDRQLKALQENQKITATSVRVGRVARVELLRIEAEVQSVEGQLAGLAGDEFQLRASLGALLDIRSFSGPVDTLLNTPPHETASENETLLEKRPDLMSAKSITRAEDENLKGAKREYLPSLSLHAEVMRNQGYTANGDNIWSATGQLTWQFWDGGRRFANMDRVNANREVAIQQYRRVFNQATAELASAQAGWKAASLQYQAAISGLNAARETERIQADRFAVGRISAADFVDAEAALARARSDHTTALANWWLADDQLHLARGQAPLAYQAHAKQKEKPHGGH